MVIINGWHDAVREPVCSGSMARPMPGFWAGTVGTQIALDFQGSDLMRFTFYVGAAEKAVERFTPDGRRYLAGYAGPRRGRLLLLLCA
jgi:acetyl-CoA synthetase